MSAAARLTRLTRASPLFRPAVTAHRACRGRTYASEASSEPGSGPDIEAMKEQFRNSPMFEKISGSVGAMEAVKEMGALMMKKGGSGGAGGSWAKRDCADLRCLS